MIKNLIILVFTIFSFKNSFSQKYFQIEGTNRIFTYYGKTQSVQVNDSVKIFFCLKGNIFFIQTKILKKKPTPFIKYIILDKTEKRKITSIGRGDSTVTKVRFINVNILKAEKSNSDSQSIEQLLIDSQQKNKEGKTK